MDAFAVVAAVAALVAGAIASISGFGIGSVRTPVLSSQFDVRLAIGMVSLPHLVGTFVRFLLVRARIDRVVLLGFGAASAVGGLVGAALQTVVQSSALAVIFVLPVALRSELTLLATRGSRPPYPRPASR